MAVALELGGISDPEIRRAFERLSLLFPLASNLLQLRTVRGNITGTTGAIAQGSGFTCVRNGVGDYTITFTPAFMNVPSVVAMVGSVSAGGAVTAKVFGGTAPTASAVRIATVTVAPAVADADFSFIAVGP